MKALWVALLLGLAAPASAGPWLREPGHFYLNTGYAHIGTSKFFSPDFSVVAIVPYQQHLWTFYGEVGVAPWLMVSVEGVALRRASLSGQGATLGVGDWRVGAWTKLPVPKVKLAFATLVGIPLRDSRPHAGAGASHEQQAVAASLPTGDARPTSSFDSRSVTRGAEAGAGPSISTSSSRRATGCTRSFTMRSRGAPSWARSSRGASSIGSRSACGSRASSPSRRTRRPASARRVSATASPSCRRASR